MGELVMPLRLLVREATRRAGAGSESALRYVPYQNLAQNLADAAGLQLSFAPPLQALAAEAPRGRDVDRPGPPDSAGWGCAPLRRMGSPPSLSPPSSSS